MVRSKVMLAFATVLAVTAMLGVFAIDRLSSVNDGATLISKNYLVASNNLGDFAYQSTRYRQFQAAALLMTALDDKATEEKSALASAESANKAWDAYSKTIDAGTEQEIATKMHGLWA